jgi:hypothetical protein
MYKILSNILLSRLTPYAEKIFGECQCGFRRNRSTTHHRFCIRQILEKKKSEYKEALHQPFIDFKRAYDSVRRGALYNIPMKLVRLIKMCLTETYRRVRVGMFPIMNGLKQGDALSPLLFNFALEYAIRRVQVNQDGLKLNGTYQLLVYTDIVNMLGGTVQAVKKNAETFVVTSKETGVEVNVDKTKYVVMFRDQKAGRSHRLIDNMSSNFERLEEFNYFGANLTYQSYIQEEIKSRLKLGNSCYHSAQNLLSSSVLCQKFKD